MNFNSIVFILLFLPLAILGFYLFSKLSRLAGKIFLIIAGLIFYLYGGWIIFLAFLGSIVANLIFSSIIAFQKQHQSNAKAAFIIGIVFNVLYLIVFKYSTWFINDLLKLDWTFWNILLPVGISFYTFQQISFLTFNFKQNEIKRFSILDYLVYITFFPKLLMGPLIEYDDFEKQLNSEDVTKFNTDNLLTGIKLVCFGLFKKVIIADLLAKIVNSGISSLASLSCIDVLIIAVSYTFQIYFDFSGYSDMAIGISYMMNIELPTNFNSPYKATSIRDFWKKWHMSLTKFLTVYIYIPLGGSKKNKFRTCLNVFVVFLISGIWHGANLTFIVWGIVYGVISIIERFVPDAKSKVGKAFRCILTFCITCFMWLLFRAESLEQWTTLLAKLFSFRDMTVNISMLNSFSSPIISLACKIPYLNNNFIWLVLTILLSAVLCFVPKNNIQKKKDTSIPVMLLCSVLLIVCVYNINVETGFVYFGF